MAICVSPRRGNTASVGDAVTGSARRFVTEVAAGASGTCDSVPSDTGVPTGFNPDTMSPIAPGTEVSRNSKRASSRSIPRPTANSSSRVSASISTAAGSTGIRMSGAGTMTAGSIGKPLPSSSVSSVSVSFAGSPFASLDPSITSYCFIKETK